MKYTYTETIEKTIDILDIYPQDKLDEIQKEWEIVDFRIPQGGEIYLIHSTYTGAQTNVYQDGYKFSLMNPRAILKKKPKREEVNNKTCVVSVRDIYGVEEIELPLAWKYKNFRTVGAGEEYVNPHDIRMIERCSVPPPGPRIIVERSCS